MAKDKKTPLRDDEILPIVEAKVRRGVGSEDGKLAKERERVLKYYNSQLPVRQNLGRSSYVSTDVYDSVEAMRAQLLETFSGNPDNLVSFPPLHDGDYESSLVATEYCSYMVWRLNPGWETCSDVIDDALKARVGVVKVYWEEKYDEFEEEVTGSLQDVQALAAQEDVTELEAEVDPAQPGVFTGTLTRRVDTSQVRIDPLAPEEFIIEQSATCIKDAGMVCHRTLKTKAELKKEGYDPNKIDSINWSDARSLDLTAERLERELAVSDASGLDDAVQTELEKVMFYETYIKLDMREGKGVKLWKICHAAHVLLDKEECDRAPFKAFTPLRIAHTFHGNNFAARVIPTQNARTVLTRAILDHASVSTTPRWGVVKGGLMNPKEMSDTRLGGIVNMTRPDAVMPLPQHTLNPFIFQTLEMLKTNKEESTGISSLSQGLNKDAISTQNSAALVDNLVTLSQQRQKIIARAFASFLVELYLEVYRLVLENAKKEDIIQVAGQYKPVKVSDWVERKTCKVALHLGYGERDAMATKISNTFQAFSTNPLVQPMFQPQNVYDMAMDAMKIGGLERCAHYLSTPDKIQPKQPDPLDVQKVQNEQLKAQAAQTQAQAAVIKNDKQATVAALKENMQEAKLRVDATFREQESARMDAETANRIDVSQREIELLENAPPAAEKAIVSP